MRAQILVYDNNSHAAWVTGAIVARAVPEAHVHVSTSLAGAYQALERQAPDLLILDPPPSSDSALRLIAHLRQRRPEALVLVLASNPNPGLQRAMQRAAVDYYLEKPIDQPTLSEQISQILHEHGQAAQLGD